MMDMTQKTEDFLRRIGVHPCLTDIDLVSEAFMKEMDRGLAGESSSLAMIPTYIHTGGIPAEDRPVIAIDAGGTNLRIGLVTFRDGAPVVEKVEKHPIPGSHGEVSADEFFSRIAELVMPLTEYTDMVGFCFSYPTEITEERDGIIRKLNKELKVTGAEGMYIGRTLMEKLRERGLEKTMRIVLLNDTVAGLMGGIACLGLDGSGGLAGLILGTGSNTCYFERGDRIKKLKNPMDMIVNCESGNFSGAPAGEPDRRLDAQSACPGSFWFEKKMSGAYMGKLITQTAAMAAEEGLLSPAFGQESFTTPELDEFVREADNRVSRLCTGSDRQVLTQIIESLFERAAKLVCASIAALCLHSGGGIAGTAPFTVVAEGSMFWGSMLFHSILERYLAEHVEAKLNRHVRICRAENSTLSGAALSALLNL